MKLPDVVWSSERHYRMLAYYFTIRANSDVADEPHRLIARFEVPEDTREVRFLPPRTSPPSTRSSSSVPGPATGSGCSSARP